VKSDRGVFKRFGAEALDQPAGREDERVARLDALTPHVRQYVGDAAQRFGLARRRPMDEIRELSRFVAGQKESRAPYEEDLRGADPRRVELVVHDHRAGAVKRHASALVTEALSGPTIRLPQRLAERHLDPRRKVVVVLLASEVGHFLRDIAARAPVLPRDLTQEVEAPFRPERRAKGGFARDDHVWGTGSQLRGRADLRREAQRSHRWRV